MNAQLLLSPSLFEMDSLARERYHERPNEGMDIETFIDHVRAGTNVARLEREFEVHEPGCRGLMYNILSYLHSLESLTENIGLFDIPDIKRFDDEMGCINTRTQEDEWFFLNRTRRGAKFSRVLLKKLNSKITSCIPPDACENVIKDIQTHTDLLRSFIEQWGKYPLDKTTFTVVATREPNAFMRLGNNKCDKESCYRQSSDYSPHSPLNLAVTPDIYVFYIKRGEDVLARAWGQLVEDGQCFFANTYARNMPGDSEGARSVFKEAIKYWGKCKEWTGSCCVEELHGQYWNGDTYGNEDTIICRDAPCEFQYNRCTCESCEEGIDPDDAHCVEGYGYHCENCLDEYFRWSEWNSEYIYQDYAVYCSDLDDYARNDQVVSLHDGESCLEENALKMYCGEFVFADLAIGIDLGEHGGSCTHEDDGDLMTTDEGETYIEGTYTPESEDDS